MNFINKLVTKKELLDFRDQVKSVVPDFFGVGLKESKANLLTARLLGTKNFETALGILNSSKDINEKKDINRSNCGKKALEQLQRILDEHLQESEFMNQILKDLVGYRFDWALNGYKGKEIEVEYERCWRALVEYAMEPNEWHLGFVDTHFYDSIREAMTEEYRYILFLEVIRNVDIEKYASDSLHLIEQEASIVLAQRLYLSAINISLEELTIEFIDNEFDNDLDNDTNRKNCIREVVSSFREDVMSLLSDRFEDRNDINIYEGPIRLTAYQKLCFGGFMANVD
ncbi:hypothetical protein A3715_15525 [Oleiphilus sp. HI0009]|nr:hypothetical protein A3715_15525 [Oleiphilus sp. HI0009]